MTRSARSEESNGFGAGGALGVRLAIDVVVVQRKDGSGRISVDMRLRVNVDITGGVMGQAEGEANTMQR